MGELRAALAALAFKPKQVTSIFSLLIGILLIGNIEFVDNGDRELSYESASIKKPQVLEAAARHLGVEADDLAQALTNKTKFIRRELASIFLLADGSAVQRDSFVRDLYAILFAFIVEASNRKLAPSDDSSLPPLQIHLFDQGGFQSRSAIGSINASGHAPLMAAYGQNRFQEFCINFSNEIMQSRLLRQTFDDSVGFNSQATQDRVFLPRIVTMDNAACIELLRGGLIGSRADSRPNGIIGALEKACARYTSGKAREDKDEELLDELSLKFGVHGSFVTSPDAGLGPATERTLFGINHYAGSCSYDINGFIEDDLDVLDAAFVSLLRGSSDTFISRLVSGPSIAAEMHPQDDQTVVQAQVLISPLRRPTSIVPSPFSSGSFLSPRSLNNESLLDPSHLHTVTSQLNTSLSDFLANLDLTRSWNVICLRPNDEMQQGSFEKRRVRSQIRQFLLCDIIARKRIDFVADYDVANFMRRFAVREDSDRPATAAVRGWAEDRGWVSDRDFAVGEHRIWIAYDAFKEVEDELRESEERMDGAMNHDTESVATADASQHQANLQAPSAAWSQHIEAGESAENLLAQRLTKNGSGYFAPAEGRGYQGYSETPAAFLKPKAGYAESWTEPELWEKTVNTSASANNRDDRKTKEVPALAMVSKAPQTVEVIPTSGSRRWWVRFVWLMTWMFPNFCLSSIGKMKRADVRLAWREKVTICLLIFCMCGVVIFYVVIFGKLLCPNFDYAWNGSQLSEHATTSSYYVAVAGAVLSQ